MDADSEKAQSMNDGRPLLSEYVKNGWYLVEIQPGHKHPIHDKWNEKAMCIGGPEMADVAEWLHGNVGLAHAYSGSACIDVDDLDLAIVWLQAKGIDLSALLNARDAVRIESRPGRAKLLYRVSKPLPSFKLGKSFELRCGTANGLTVQDVLPPSIHPITGKPYTWKYNTPEGHWSKLPPLPPDIAALWASCIPPKVAKPGRPKRSDAVTVEAAQLRATLALHDPSCVYDEWIAVGMALHHETKGSDEGLGLWNEWSSRGEKYKGLGDLDFHWRSFKLDHDNPRTLASLRVQTVAEAQEFPDGTKVPPKRAIALPSKGKREIAEQTVRALTKGRFGKIEAKISNIAAVLGLAEISGYELALDVFLDAIVVMQQDSNNWRPLTDTDYTALRIWLETYGNCDPISHDMMRHAVHLVAEQQQMDSAQQWLAALKWDAVPRIERFCSRYFGTQDNLYTRRVGEYLWTALAGRVLSPGCQADMVPVLIGAQGVGKSRGVMAMSPDPSNFAEVRIDDPDDTIARKMRGALVGELAEMRGMRAAEVERVKAFITRTYERWVPKYKEFAITYPRRFIMIGTTNDDEFLPMDTEHRRWLPMLTKQVDVAAIARDREQLWAEGATRYTLDGIAWQDLDILALPARAEAIGVDTWTDEVAAWLESNRPAHPQATHTVRLQDVMTQAVGLDPRIITRVHELRCGRILRTLGYAKRVMRNEQGRAGKAWCRDPLADLNDPLS